MKIEMLRDSAIGDTWEEYLRMKFVFMQVPTQQNLNELNRSVDAYLHTLRVYKPTKEQILYATEYAYKWDDNINFEYVKSQWDSYGRTT